MRGDAAQGIGMPSIAKEFYGRAAELCAAHGRRDGRMWGAGYRELVAECEGEFGGGLGAAVPMLVLEMTGYVPGEAQSAQALAGINLAFAIIPVAILVPSGIALYFYRLDHRTMAQVESDLAVRRAEM